MRALAMEFNIAEVIATHGMGGAALFILWRLTEKIGVMAESFAACGAKMDTILQLLGKDRNHE
jgi:hypothetical protein